MKNIVIVLMLLVSIAQASSNLDILKEKKTLQRVALVIGNNDYAHLHYLKNPLNDAKLVRDVLIKNGFSVMYEENANIRKMKKILRKFAFKIKKGDIGLLYFAGHSANVDGKNYLVGVDAELDNKAYIEHEAISLNEIIKKMRRSKNRLNMIISDTCRNTIKKQIFDNNHFGRGVGNGLLGIINTEDIFIAYSTASGELARDGKNSSHGILTQHFVQNLQNKDLSIKEIFQTTKKDVYGHSNAIKNSSVYNQILKDFFFILPTKP